MTGTTQPEQKDAVLFVKIHDFDVAPMGGDVGSQGIERAFDAIDRVHGPPDWEFLQAWSEYNGVGARPTALLAPDSQLPTPGSVGQVLARGFQHGGLHLRQGAGER